MLKKESNSNELLSFLYQIRYLFKIYLLAEPNSHFWPSSDANILA